MKFSVMIKCFAIFAMLFVFFNFSAGCDVNGSGVTQTWIDTDIGPDGGEIVGSMGSRIIIPQGALEDWVTITVEEMPSEEIPEHQGFTRISSGLLLKPEGLSFKVPVSIYIPYARFDYSISQQKTGIAMYSTTHVEIPTTGGPTGEVDDTTAKWTKLEGSVDTDQHISRAESSHFSIFAVYFQEGSAVDGDVDGDQGLEQLDCNCDKLLGEWIVMTSNDCTDTRQIVVSNSTENSCAKTVELQDGFGEVIQGFGLTNCEEGFSVPLQFESQSDCKLEYDSENDALKIQCSDCGQAFVIE